MTSTIVNVVVNALQLFVVEHCILHRYILQIIFILILFRQHYVPFPVTESNQFFWSNDFIGLYIEYTIHVTIASNATIMSSKLWSMIGLGLCISIIPIIYSLTCNHLLQHPNQIDGVDQINKIINTKQLNGIYCKLDWPNSRVPLGWPSTYPM